MQLHVMNLEINCRKEASGICLKVVTTVSHIPVSKCAKNNSRIKRTLEAVINFVKKLHIFSGFTLNGIVHKNN
jgi:hypothetical protein